MQQAHRATTSILKGFGKCAIFVSDIYADGHVFVKLDDSSEQRSRLLQNKMPGITFETQNEAVLIFCVGFTSLSYQFRLFGDNLYNTQQCSRVHDD